jgi:glycosyltransferase involved in cell wall biosynthesis
MGATPDRRGYGYAYLYAFRHARGDIIVADADDTYDMRELPKLLKPIIEPC